MRLQKYNRDLGWCKRRATSGGIAWSGCAILAAAGSFFQVASVGTDFAFILRQALGEQLDAAAGDGAVALAERSCG